MQEHQVVDTSLRNKNRRMLIIIGLAFLAPVILSWLAFRYGDWDVADATAKGTLVYPARPVTAIEFLNYQNEPDSIESYQGKWTLLYAANEVCGPRCARNVENLNITRLALGEETQRVQGLILMPRDTSAATAAVAWQDFPNIHPAYIDRHNQDKLAELLRWPSAEGRNPEYRIFIIDPLGNLMMLYEDGDDPKKILLDLRKLLKASRIG